MWSMHAGLLLLLLSSAYGFQSDRSPPVPDAEAEWNRLAKLVDDEPGPAAAIGRSPSGGTMTINKASFPPYIRIPTSKYPTAAFKPERGVRPLPNFARELLLVPSSSSSAGSSQSSIGTPPARHLIEMLCHDDRIYVRIVRLIFKSKYAYNDLKMGNCPVNQGTKQHYYFLYRLSSNCGFAVEGKSDFVSLNNVLSYKPGGVVVRQSPFNVGLQCKYPRTFLSYKMGFYPTLQGGTIFKALTPKLTVALSVQDASGNMLSGTKTYFLGQPMYFEVKWANDSGSAGGQRLYINKCFMTANRQPNSSPKYTIIDHQGCLVESKVAANSKFLMGSSKMSVRFTIPAFIFNNAASTSATTRQLYMHCEASVGRSQPSPSSKACHYDSVANKWKELYGHDNVCTCCDGTCPKGQPRASKKTISGPTWKVDLSGHSDDEEAEPWTKSDVDPVVEGVDKDEESDFTNYWEEDYD